MNRKLWLTLAIGLALIASLLTAFSAAANPPAPEAPTRGAQLGPSLSEILGNPPAVPLPGKDVDVPNAKDAQRLEERKLLLQAGNLAEAGALAKTGTDRVLVVLVEFGGPDTFTWHAPTDPADPKTGSTWDPLGKADPAEAVYDEDGNVIGGDCSNIIKETKDFTYSGPLHNQIPRPLSAADRSGDTIWTENFDRQWFQSFMFGNGVKFQYTREDDSVVDEDFIGRSVTNYYSDMSRGQYTVTGDVFGWLKLPHSEFWYGHDLCPGARSGTPGGWPSHGGVVPGAGSSRTMVIDALKALNAISNTIPGFDWKNYDLDKDGEIDRLWIVHAGYGEEDGTVLLNRTDYGESADWSHSSAVSPAYQVVPGVNAGAYIMMPENGGIGVFAHESGHNLGTDDLYSYGGGETSAGFWTLMADDWTGYPIGYMPPALDPLHLDLLGWLNPLVIDDPDQIYEFELSQASNPEGCANCGYTGARIDLPTGYMPLTVQPIGAGEWWGGKQNQKNAMMTQKTAVALAAGKAAELSFQLAYNIEEAWDFLWVQVSDDGGATWDTLTNANTQCDHDSGWIGGLNGFPDDLCAAGLGGFTGEGATFPAFAEETFDLSAYAGKSVLVRFWYMTDWGTSFDGAFIDSVKITSNGAQVFADNADTAASDANWTYAAPWIRSNGTKPYSQSYYLQWRNVGRNGGYDAGLGDARFRFGPTNTGLLVWYNNDGYTDNEILTGGYLNDVPGFGPKGMMLVVDAHPEPYRDPYWVDMGYANESSNLLSRMQMRDAPFSLNDSVPFTTTGYTHAATMVFPGRPAISSFHDAFGYYPGVEQVVRSPLQPAPVWVTAQWDASTVVPAREPYGVKAPGYNGTDPVRYGCERYPDDKVYCYGFPAGLGYAGTTGDPVDLGVQYGWHVRILDQAADGTSARIQVWNSAHGLDDRFTANADPAQMNRPLTFTYDVVKNAGSAVDAMLFIPLDNTKLTYVPGSATGGLFPFYGSASPADLARAYAQGGRSAVEQMAAGQAGEPTMLVGVIGQLAIREAGPTYTFRVTPKPVPGTLTLTASLYDGEKFQETPATVALPWTQVTYLPTAHTRGAD